MCEILPKHASNSLVTTFEIFQLLGTSSPRPLPGLCPWTPLGDSRPQTPCGFAPSKLPSAAFDSITCSTCPTWLPSDLTSTNTSSTLPGSHSHTPAVNPWYSSRTSLYTNKQSLLRKLLKVSSDVCISETWDMKRYKLKVPVLSEWISSPTESLMHGIIYPLLSVLLVYPPLIGLLGALILEIFWNVIVVNLKGSCYCSFLSLAVPLTLRYTLSYLYLSFWANKWIIIIIIIEYLQRHTVATSKAGRKSLIKQTVSSLDSDWASFYGLTVRQAFSPYYLMELAHFKSQPLIVTCWLSLLVTAGQNVAVCTRIQHHAMVEYVLDPAQHTLASFEPSTFSTKDIWLKTDCVLPEFCPGICLHCGDHSMQ